MEEKWETTTDTNDRNQMVLCYPSTPKRLSSTIACFLGSVSLFGYGLYLWHVNIGPQQARIKARNEFVRERLRKKHGKE